jgi:deazaflavin-dependent oxidoreductase (nitroreductase family)
MAVTRNAFVELFWRVHPTLYRWSVGRIGGAIGGMPVLLLTTTGRKSGEPRTTALTYLPRGDDFVVIASVLGEPRHPAWWLNLAAKPDATVRWAPPATPCGHGRPTARSARRSGAR